jgi:hypothetical protein
MAPSIMGDQDGHPAFGSGEGGAMIGPIRSYPTGLHELCLLFRSSGMLAAFGIGFTSGLLAHGI